MSLSENIKKVEEFKEWVYVIPAEDVKEAVKDLRKVFHTLCSAEITEHILNSIFGGDLMK